MDANQIQPHMEVVGSNGQHFAIVDHVEGDAIKLTKDAQGQHHYLPLDWVANVDQVVHLNLPGDQAMRQWLTTPPAH